MMFKTLMTLTMVLAAASAHACTCIGTPTTQEAYDGADFVFHGTVLQTSDVDGSRNVVFQVEGSWKGGNVGNAAYVTTADNGGECGVGFVTGQSWVVFAYESSNEPWFWTHLCTLNRTGQAAQNIIWELGPVPTEKNAWGTLKARYR